MVRGKTQALCASRLLKEAYAYERRCREDHARDASIVRGVPVALQEVASHDVPLHPCHGCQGEPAAGYRVTCRVHGWIGRALQVLVHRDAPFSRATPVAFRSRSSISDRRPAACTPKSASTVYSCAPVRTWTSK